MSAAVEQPISTPAAAEPSPPDASQSQSPDDTAFQNKDIDPRKTTLQTIDIGQEQEVGSTSESPLGSADSLTADDDPTRQQRLQQLQQQPQQDWDHELKRVKVYELIGSRWVDQGTAFCCGSFAEDTGDALLVARAENNHDHIILSTTIRLTDVYQRQQDTLIVWTEPDGMDYALSFQDPDGCLEVWNFILEVQRYLTTAERTPSSPTVSDASQTAVTIMRTGHLPPPTLGIIGDIDVAIRGLARTQPVKERLCEYIQQEEYLKAMIDVMNQAEDLENLENLHALCGLMQTILMLNDHTIYEHILEDDIFFGVVGMLEYDPEFPTHKANYRDFLHQTSQYHQPIPITDESIQRKIHHTYRLQFLKDVVLARALDDSTFNVLNSSIIFNQIDIITYVQQDPTFLRDIVRLYVDEEMLSGGGSAVSKNGMNGNTHSPTVKSPIANGKQASEGSLDAMDIDTKETDVVSANDGRSPSSSPDESKITTQREVVSLIQQLCVMGKNVQLPARLALFRSLVDRGILFAIQWAMGLPEKPMYTTDQNEDVNKSTISAAGEILSALLDHDLHGVRGHVVKQLNAIEKQRLAGKKSADKAETLLMQLCRKMAQSKDLAIQSQVGDALKTWLDIPPNDAEPAAGIRAVHRGKDELGTEKFLDYFYNTCASVLFKPLETVPEWKSLTEPTLALTREQTNLYLYLCDLLCNFEIQHSFRSHVFILTSNISVRVASLLKARDKHLRHAAFRFFRASLRPVSGNIRNHMMKRDVFKPLLELTLQESRRDNLLSSSCQEFFEQIRRENVKDLIKHCMTNHEPLIRRLAESPLGGQRFQLFIRRWEMNSEPMPSSDEKSPKPTDARSWMSARAQEAEEEDYFNTDDDDIADFTPAPSISSSWQRSSVAFPLSGTGASTGGNNINALKRKRRMPVKGTRPTIRTPSLGTLVDYDDDEDEESFIGPVPFLEEIQDKKPYKNSSLTRQPTTSPPPSGEDTPTSSDIEEDLASSPISIPSLRPSEKRRREDEDDDDEILERLSQRGKKQNRGGVAGEVEGKLGITPPKTVPVDIPKAIDTGTATPTKKIKLKLGSAAATVATGAGPTEESNTSAEDGSGPVPETQSTKPDSSELGVKDGDRG